DEINVLEEAYDGQLDLRIFTKHDKVLRIKRQASHCDYVVVMTDHVGHPFQEAVREHPGLLFVKGTTSNLKKTLTELAMH
ncbi:MAG TPA: hypothetical protein VK147_02970, partial [Candidatus Didemnitutus sp.]|nr:hypothetical protein [Candidatus Didemnitutus sp.]